MPKAEKALTFLPLSYPRRGPIDADVRKEDRELEAVFSDVQDDHHRERLQGCRISLVWRLNARTDPSGHAGLYEVNVVPEVYRLLGMVDVLIVVNRAAWRDLPDYLRTAAADSALQRIGQKLTEKGVQKRLEQVGEVWLTTEPACGEFPEVVERRGLWTVRLQELAAAAKRAPQLDLSFGAHLPESEEKPKAKRGRPKKAAAGSGTGTEAETGADGGVHPPALVGPN